MKVTVRNGQSLTDIAVQVYGSAEAVFMLATENALSITDRLTAGAELDYSSENIIDKRVVDFYKDNKLYPCTEYPVEIRLFDATFDNTFN